MEYPGLVLDMPSQTAAAHELAHQWFYGIVGDDEYTSPWLDESFTDYATDLYFNKTGSGCGITWQSAAEKLTNSMAYWDAHAGRYGTVVYGYGKCTLHDLRRVLGDAPMAKLLKDYVLAHWYGISTTAEFKTAAQKVAAGLKKPVDLTSFWKSHRVEG
jgi:aminopeptidase N